MTKRPNISLENPRKWNRPVKKGVIPAYDEALTLIKEDSVRLKKERKGVLARIEKLEKLTEKDDAVLAEIQELRKKADILELQSEINQPSVRWKAYNGMGTFKQILHSCFRFVNQTRSRLDETGVQTPCRAKMEESWRP